MQTAAGTGSERIAFVIAAYNDAEGLRRHFDYFIRMDRPAELIVIDDASTDGLEDLIRDTSLPDQVALRYHRNAVNRGPGPSRNTGLDMVQSDWMMFLDADDVLTAEFFDYIALSPLITGADFVLFKHHLCRDPKLLFSYDMHPGDNCFFSNMAPSGFPDRAFAVREIPSVLRIVNFPWNKVYRTGFLRGAGIRFPDIRIHEDIRPHWQSCLRADRFGILNWAPPLIHHFEIPGANRATNYVGDNRLVAFATLTDVLDAIRSLPEAAWVIPELLALADDLLGWMCRAAPEDMAARFREAAQGLHDRARLSLGNVRAASDMGQIIS